MAENRFTAATAILTTVTEIVYEAPETVTSIVVSCQVANTSSLPARVTLNHFTAEDDREIPLASNFEIPGNDAYNLTLGRLVISGGDAITASSDTDAPLRLVVGLLETPQ